MFGLVCVAPTTEEMENTIIDKDREGVSQFSTYEATNGLHSSMYQASGDSIML
jgi:hypothetical protein